MRLVTLVAGFLAPLCLIATVGAINPAYVQKGLSVPDVHTNGTSHLKELWRLLLDNDPCKAFREFFKANCLQSPHPHDPQHTARNDAISAAAPPPLAGNQGQEFGSLRIQSNGTNATHVEVHCKLLKHVYKAQCSPSIHQAADTVSLLLLVLLLAGLAANVLAKCQWTYVSEATASILIGYFAGYFISRTSTYTIASLGDKGFFLYVLPPIVFHYAAFPASKTALFVNLPYILTLSVLGSLASALISGMLVYSWGILPFAESFIWGTVNAGVDVFPSLAGLANYGADSMLLTIMTGEALVSSGTAAQLLQVIKPNLVALQTEWFALLQTLGTFLTDYATSALMGCAAGFAIGFITKNVNFYFGGPQLEVISLLLLIFLPFYFSQYVELCGLLGLIFEALMLQMYALHNISLEAKQHMEFIAECAAHIAQNCALVYIGIYFFLSSTALVWNTTLLCGALASALLSRAAVTFIVVPLINIGRTEQRQVTIKHQAMLWVTGIRGALSVALAAAVPYYDEVLDVGAKYSRELNYMTHAVVVFGCIIQAAFVLPCTRLFGVSMTGDYAEPEEEKTLDEEDIDLGNMGGFTKAPLWLHTRVHMRILKPLLAREVPVELETRTPYYGAFFRPERKLSQAVFNITIEAQQKQLTHALDDMEYESVLTNSRGHRNQSLGSSSTRGYNGLHSMNSASNDSGSAYQR